MKCIICEKRTPVAYFSCMFVCRDCYKMLNKRRKEQELELKRLKGGVNYE